MDTYAAFYKAMGASVVKVPFSELYTSLQKGVIDGQDNGPINTYTFGFYEVQPYFTWTRHTISYVCLGINKKLFNSLPSDIQGILIKQGKLASKLINDGQRGQYQVCLEKMTEKMNKAGGQIITQLTPEQQNEFRKIGYSVWPQFEKTIGKDLMDKAYKEIGGRPKQ